MLERRGHAFPSCPNPSSLPATETEPLQGVEGSSCWVAWELCSGPDCGSSGSMQMYSPSLPAPSKWFLPVRKAAQGGRTCPLDIAASAVPGESSLHTAQLEWQEHISPPELYPVVVGMCAGMGGSYLPWNLSPWLLLMQCCLPALMGRNQREEAGSRAAAPVTGTTPFWQNSSLQPHTHFWREDEKTSYNVSHIT